MAVTQSLKLYQGTQDLVANTTKLRILWKSTQSGDSYNNNRRTANYWVSVNGGTEQKYSVEYTLPKGKTQTILDVTITVPHDDLGKCTVTVRTWMDTRISAGVIQKSASMDPTPIPRANTISASDAYIGGTLKITVVRKSASYLHDILYSFQGTTGTIAEKSAQTEYDFSIPSNWDVKMPNDKTASITLTAVTYAGDTEIGRNATTAKIMTDGTFAPQLSWDVVDINPDTIDLTGNASRLIRGASTARATLTATALRGATIKSTKINGVATAALEIEGVQNGAFTFSAVDSRGWESNQAISLSMIPYIPLTAIIEAERGAQGTNALTVTVKGNYFNGSFATAEPNILTLEYRADDGAWTAVTPTIEGNTYTAEIALALDYQTAHGLYFRIVDKITTLTPSQLIPIAVPQTMEGEGWIRHNVPVIDRLNHDCYVGRGDTDESGLEAWLDELMDDMPDYSRRGIMFVCSAVTGYTICAELYKHDGNYASVLGHAYDGNTYHKAKYNGIWNATVKG